MSTDADEKDVEATEGDTVAEEDLDDDYKPADLGPPPPEDETERRKLREATEEQAVRREILAGRLAKAHSLLFDAEEAGDEARANSLRKKVAALAAEREDI